MFTFFSDGILFFITCWFKNVLWKEVAMTASAAVVDDEEKGRKNYTFGSLPVKQKFRLMDSSQVYVKITDTFANSRSSGDFPLPPDTVVKIVW